MLRKYRPLIFASAFARFSGSGTPTYTDATTTTQTTYSTVVANSSANGGAYNFGSSASGTSTANTDRALGFILSSGYPSPAHLLLAIQNTSSSTITSLRVQFDLEQYRDNTVASDWKFYSGTNGTDWTPPKAGDQNFPAATGPSSGSPLPGRQRALR